MRSCRRAWSRSSRSTAGTARARGRSRCSTASPSAWPSPERAGRSGAGPEPARGPGVSPLAATDLGFPQAAGYASRPITPLLPVPAMRHANPRHFQRLSARRPLVFDTRTLGLAAVRSETRTAPAPASVGVELVTVREGADLGLEVRLGGVAEGVLVTATVRAPLVGECARCLDLFASATEVRFTELFAREASDDDADGYL